MATRALFDSVNRKIHPRDSLAPVYEAQSGLDAYFHSALAQVDLLDNLTRTYLRRPLAALDSVADFACHYGRLLRALRAAAPKVTLVACDIDREALAFCAAEFGTVTFHSAWSPTSTAQIPTADFLVCLSLVTHTRQSFLADVLSLWKRIVRPGGLFAFTFLGESFMPAWKAGEMAHYGPASADDIARVSREFERDGHAFHGYQTSYSANDDYGIGFMSKTVVVAQIESHGGLEVLEYRGGPNNGFGQDLIVVRRLDAS